MANLAALLLLADSRLPAGGYAHSGGLEAAVAAGLVDDVASLEHFLAGRAATVGLLGAAVAAAACRVTAAPQGHRAAFTALDDALDARTPSPAQRNTSRQLGRQLVRVLGQVAPDPRLGELAGQPHHAVALGAGAAVLGLDARAAAYAYLHESVAGPAAAAIRLLALDPFATHAALARLRARLDRLASRADEYGAGTVADLPAPAAPLLDVYAEAHAARTSRLFAS